jgi:hypothetical protein
VGLEAECAATLGDARSRGKAALETTELAFRGGFRARVPLGEVEAIDVAGDSLLVRWRGQTLALELGAAAAARWADKLRHPPSRLDKLGVKPGSRVAVIGAFDLDFLTELRAHAAHVRRGVPPAPVDLIFYAAAHHEDLADLDALVAGLRPDGALWIVRPKGGGAPIGERDVMAAGHAAGLVDVKVAAFSATHSAGKFVIPVARRQAAPAAVKPSRATAKNPPRRRSTSAPAKTPPRRARRSAPRG